MKRIMTKEAMTALQEAMLMKQTTLLFPEKKEKHQLNNLLFQTAEH